jgi:predicted AlkP superfamily pyrophosphatase or phosphodiesterase
MRRFYREWSVSTAILLSAGLVCGQTAPRPAARNPRAERPKLVVMIVVDQMRADYIDKFRGQWSGGLKRLIDEGAWFRAAAYPYAATETCVGHSTISTGAFPAEHGMVANTWWDRDAQKMVTCTGDPNAKNIAYAGGSTKGGDSAWRLQIPAFSDELRFQTRGQVNVVALSLKARAAITLAGHKSEAGPKKTVVWFDPATGSWATSDSYGVTPFAEEYIKHHPVNEDYGKVWSLSLPQNSYLYAEKKVGAETVEGWGAEFPHALRGKEGSNAPDVAFYDQWETSPYADTYLTKMAEAAVTALQLWNKGETDYLGVSYSSVDLVGHTYGPRSWEVQDILVRLDKDLGELFAALDRKVGRENYVVALSADHGVAPTPLDMQSTGVDAGVLSLPELKERMEKALVPFKYAQPAIARVAGNEIYFAPGVYWQLSHDAVAIHALVEATLNMPGVAAVFRADELSGENTTLSPIRTAFALNYFTGRSGDMFVLQKPYWLLESSTDRSLEHAGAGHGSPYYYDQRVPLLLMGFGIKPGQYFQAVTPADIAPTFGALTGVTLATRDGRVLAEALKGYAAK